MRTLGKYQLVEKIGVGGFGEVYKAFDPYIKRHVAVKTCASESEEMRTRFFQEAEIAGNLHHKNITTVYDFGLEDGLPFLIQEYLSGEDLDRKIKRREFLPYPEKLFYLLQTARGLSYAHEKGVIHRDIKPANIRILEDGTAKIMDFGIAKLQQQESGLTQTGMTLGTAAYLAPEQIRGDSVSLATDVFSFGVLAYELFAYERPFPGDQISAVLYALLHEEPKPITEHWPSAPDDIVAVIERCLDKDAAERFPDAGELLRELESIQKRGRPGNARRTRQTEADAATRALPAAASESRREPAAGEPSTEPFPGGIDEVDISLGGTHRALSERDAEPESQPKPGPQEPPAPGAGTTAPAGRSEALSPAELAEQTRERSRIRETLGRTQAASAAGGPPAWVWWVVVGLLAVIAGFLGWWIGVRDGGEPAASAPVETEDVARADGDGVAAGGPAEDQASGGVAAGPEDDASETEAPPPAAPARGTLVLRAPPWTDAMVVQIDGGPRRPLQSELTLALDAGGHRVLFDLAETGYRVRRTVEVDVQPGETEVLSPPVDEPGYLVVRPLPRTPQAVVRVDDGEVMSTPLNSIPLAPGEHRLTLRPRGDATAEPLTRTVEIRSGARTIVAFDLDAGRVDLIEP